MRSFRQVRSKLLIGKALLYRFISFTTQGIFLYMLLDDIEAAIKFSFVIELIKTVGYFLYDYTFARFFRATKNEGCVLWFTGLPCSGKTTVADVVADKLKSGNVNVERLDGDIVRKSLTSDLGFSKADRAENLKRVTCVAKLLSRNGVIVPCTFVSPYITARDKIKNDVTNFIEVYVDCPVEECEKRDVKGMYALARQGKIKDFTGVDDPYEPPNNPQITLYTANETIEESTNKILDYLKDKQLI